MLKKYFVYSKFNILLKNINIVDFNVYKID